MATRRLRAFKRWMRSQGIEYSDALCFTDSPEGEGIAVRALCDLKVGDMVARIPKAACLTMRTSGASDLIESAGLGGSLGLAVALMYERSLGEDSPWAGYLQLLPPQECLPLLWTLDDLDSLLRGTELHKTVKEDKGIIYEDWKDSILPLLDSPPFNLDPKCFGIEQYFAAKSLIASRSFEVDEYHGSGMVPLADLFNHKTGAEDVHITSLHSYSDSESDSDTNKSDTHVDTSDNDTLIQDSYSDQKGPNTTLVGKNPSRGSDSDFSSVSRDDTIVLEMVMVKNVEVGAEVFNTYGLVGNAALLHRYGFTEPNNPFDIVNIDMELLLQWSSSSFSDRYRRTRLALWRKLDYCGCVSQDTEYFEISFDGEPQIELLILLYIMLLPEDTYHKLDLTVSTAGNSNGSIGMILSEEGQFIWEKASEVSKDLLLTEDVCDALLSLADMRESFYGSNSIEDDIEALGNCCIRERKLYHSLMLRVSERRILERLRTYAAVGAQSFRTAKRSSVRKKLKKK
ncbi:ribosomal lysine N-methyltransferase 3 [Corylus avellana]|uniref:ribosomal lysine N-methyltransferase 3 n=1 Tax=Corylus avellana TaxID=13451 RepID=UPI001E20924B|nr:ribosomal lysine N-methyltransferase 3 [Corylus avellana]